MKDHYKFGLSMRVFSPDGYDDPRDALAHDWAYFLECHYVLPVPILNCLKDPVVWAEEVNMDCLLLTGGGDLEHVVNDPYMRELERKRDQTEQRLIKWAITNNMPVLGVCRGMYALNHYLGGSLTYNRSLKSAGHKKKHVACVHKINMQGDWERFGVCSVNSFHDSCLLMSDLAEDCNILALSEDGCIEAFKHKILPLWGIQWHPERMGSETKLDEEIIKQMKDAVK